jgi:superfamily II DNA helicase RecQ
MFRDNLYISAVARQGNGNQQILDFLEKHLNEQGIIYAQSRAKTESLAPFSCKNLARLSVLARD